MYDSSFAKLSSTWTDFSTVKTDSRPLAMRIVKKTGAAVGAYSNPVVESQQAQNLASASVKINTANTSVILRKI